MAARILNFIHFTTSRADDHRRDAEVVTTSLTKNGSHDSSPFSFLSSSIDIKRSNDETFHFLIYFSKHDMISLSLSLSLSPFPLSPPPLPPYPLTFPFWYFPVKTPPASGEYGSSVTSSSWHVSARESLNPLLSR